MMWERKFYRKRGRSAKRSKQRISTWSRAPYLVDVVVKVVVVVVVNVVQVAVVLVVFVVVIVVALHGEAGEI